MWNYKSNNINFARLERKDTDEVVKSHLALDLRDVDAMVRDGRPVSLQNASDFYDGDTDCNFNDLHFEQQRGVDINDVWNESKRSQKVLSKAKVSKVDINSVKS